MSIQLKLRRETTGRYIFVVGNTALLTLMMLLILIPIIKVVIDSFDVRASETVFRIFPEVFTWDAYSNISTRPAIQRPFLISLFVTSVGTFLAMCFTTLFAYGLAQRDLPGKTIFLFMALITMVFRAGMIPLFLVVKKLGLMNSLLAVILVRCVDAYYLLLLRNFFSMIPSSIIDAASIDGCTPARTFFQIILPLSKPGLAAIGLFYIVYYWNQFFDYILYIQTKTHLHNFQVFLRNMVIETETGTGYRGMTGS